MLVAPHPDDETLGFGASAATLQSRGIDVQVVSVSDGEASQPGLPARRRKDLARTRRAELRSATEVLGLRPPIFLGLPDGELSAHQSELTHTLATLLSRDAGASCAATWRGDGHPDHEAVGAAAALAVETTGTLLVEYPVWMWHWAVPNDDAVPWERAAQISIDRVALEHKWRAVQMFCTQLQPRHADEPVLPRFILQRLHAVGEVVFA